MGEGRQGSLEDGADEAVLAQLKLTQGMLSHGQVIFIMMKIHRPFFFNKRDLDESALAFHRPRLVEYTRGSNSLLEMFLPPLSTAEIFPTDCRRSGRMLAFHRAGTFPRTWGCQYFVTLS